MFSDVAKRKLAALLPRLATDSDGEVLATVAAIRRVLKAEGSDLHDLAKAATEGGATVYKTVYRDVYRDPPKPETHWPEKAEYCHDRQHLLRGRELEFVCDIYAKTRIYPDLTEKQGAWLESIYQRLKRRENAAS